MIINRPKVVINYYQLNTWTVKNPSYIVLVSYFLFYHTKPQTCDSNNELFEDKF